MNRNTTTPNFENFLRLRPRAWAIIKGDSLHRNLSGSVRFYDTAEGTLVVINVRGLPTGEKDCASPIFAFHIHEGGSCGGSAEDNPFPNVLMHYNPKNCPHPYHAGDMPPLFSAGNSAFSAFLTDRFTIDEIIGKTVIIHSSPDDFTTQPSGNPGTKIACGEIMGRNR